MYIKWPSVWSFLRRSSVHYYHYRTFDKQVWGSAWSAKTFKGPDSGLTKSPAHQSPSHHRRSSKSRTRSSTRAQAAGIASGCLWKTNNYGTMEHHLSLLAQHHKRLWQNIVNASLRGITWQRYHSLKSQPSLFLVFCMKVFQAAERPCRRFRCYLIRTKNWTNQGSPRFASGRRRMVKCCRSTVFCLKQWGGRLEQLMHCPTVLTDLTVRILCHIKVKLQDKHTKSTE